MGVIKRQGIKRTIVSYLAILVAAGNTFFIYSNEKELYGLSSFLVAGATLLSPFLLWGAEAVSIRYFSHFKDKDNRNNGFLTLMAIWVVLGICLGTLMFVLLKNWLGSMLPAGE